MSSVAATQDGSFQTDVLQSEIPVLVDFWAEWCGPCRQLGPIIDQVGTELAGKVKVLKLNVDENPAVTQRFGIQSIPTIMLFSGGQARGQIVGLRPKNDILRQIESVLGVKA
ncbi:MAG: thioredoxin [Candidatus Eisenbacteria bacterium]